MPRLKCGVKTCVFYRERHCTRENIVVKGSTALAEEETKCQSFSREVPDNRDDRYKMEIGSIGEINYHMPVYCEAVNCKFNTHRVCRAKEIKIDGSRALHSDQTFCSSFAIK
ncbi:MAG TPA: DUF1540 domain-containing protein [Acholeplasmataceae bacterium]|jgi:hypothetical protein|nr:DUF1540 domain-containing protein [Acholeplasmataceae bacterium]